VSAGGTILAVRPEPGLSVTLALAKGMGLNALGHPLFEIRPREWTVPDAGGFDGLLIGSANALRHGGDALGNLVHLPVYAVGRATAEAARAAGFTVAASGTGGLQAVLDGIEGPARLLRLAGAEHVPLVSPAGMTIEERITYQAVPLELPEPLRALDTLALTVLLHSAAAATRFAGESARLAWRRNAIALACIGPRVAAAAGDGWRAVHVAPRPDDRALLEMVRAQCI
jgi:uroporphyrinogen-III synthase